MVYQPRAHRRNRVSKRKFLPHFNWLAIVICVVILVGLILAFLALFTDAFAPAPVFYPLDTTSSETIQSSNGLIYYLKGTTLHCADSKGQLKWSTKFSSGKLSLKTSENIICLYNEATATVLGTDKTPLFTLPESDFQIADVMCGSDSLAFLCTIEEDPSQYLRVFDMEGTEIDRIDLEGQQVLKYGFFGSADSLWYLTLDTSGVYPVSRIITRAPAQKTITGMYEVYDQLVSDVFFFQTDVLASGSSNLICYNSLGEKVFEKLIYGSKLEDTCKTSDDFIFAYSPRNSIDESSYSVRLVSYSGKDALIQLPSGIYDFALSNRNLYCFGKREIYVYQHSGEYLKTIDLEFELDGIQILGDGLVLLKSGSSIYSMTLE